MRSIHLFNTLVMGMQNVVLIGRNNLAFSYKVKGFFSDGSDGKESACNAVDLGSIPGSGRSPEERNGNPLQYSCLENPMDGILSLAGYIPWGHKESDMTERLFTFFSLSLQDQ